MDKIKIIIVDDHQVIHSGIVGILQNQEHIEIIDHAYNGLEAIEKAVALNPDIIFMDISMPDLNGIEACRQIISLKPDIKIIGLTQHDEHEYVVRFLESGGKGYLLKNSRQDEFLNAIQAVLHHKRYLSFELSVALTERALTSKNQEGNQEIVHLTRREIEIVKKIAHDKNNQEIADELNISLRTVETHRRNIAQKINAKSVVSILKYASQHNLIDL